MWKTHAFAKPSPTRKRNARVRHREDAIAPCVGAMTDRTHIFPRVRVHQKTAKLIRDVEKALKKAAGVDPAARSSASN